MTPGKILTLKFEFRILGPQTRVAFYTLVRFEGQHIRWKLSVSLGNPLRRLHNEGKQILSPTECHQSSAARFFSLQHQMKSLAYVSPELSGESRSMLCVTLHGVDRCGITQSNRPRAWAHPCSHPLNDQIENLGKLVCVYVCSASALYLGPNNGDFKGGALD